MTDLSTEYMGLILRNPLIASSSPLTATIEGIERLADSGIGAVVLKSIFEEQIVDESIMLERYNDYPEAFAYMNAYISAEYLRNYTRLIDEARQRTNIPIIASINCFRNGSWVEYAREIEDAGANALELNIFFMPRPDDRTSDELEQSYLEIIESVSHSVGIPVAVKFGMRFTNIFRMMQESRNRGAQGVVMFNRFFEPDIDIEKLEYTGSSETSTSAELHKSLRYVALGSSEVTGIDISVSSGVHTGEDVVKSLLAGANNVQLCSTLMLNGLGRIGEINDFITDWMKRHGYVSVGQFRGAMHKKHRFFADPLLERVQYMKFFGI